MPGTVAAPMWTKSFETGSVRQHVCRFLDTNGDGTGTKEATGNYAAAEEIFFIKPSATQVFRITRLLVTIEDTNGSTASDYGNITSGLTNGIVIRHSDDSGVITDYTDGLPIKTNGHWTSFCYDGTPLVWGNGNDMFPVRWTFLKSGQYLRLDGAVNGRLEAVFNDNLTGLVLHRFLVQGYIE